MKKEKEQRLHCMTVVLVLLLYRSQTFSLSWNLQNKYSSMDKPTQFLLCGQCISEK